MKWYTMTKRDAAQGSIADEETGRSIAVCYDPNHAPLIAAAPELLEALRNLANMVERYKHTELNMEPLTQYFEALDAIRKAEEELS